MEINGSSGEKKMKLPISAIVLTYNEEKNIESCLKSIYNWTEEIFIVDSYSNDKTLEIAKRYTDKIFQHEFENYGKQRNWALNNLSINTKWILNLDADHRVTESLQNELVKMFSSKEDLNYNGFLIPRKTVFMRKWIKYGGHYPVYHAILFRKGFGVCEETLYDQHFIVDGKVIQIKGDIEDIITDSLSNFTLRHNKWSSFQAIDEVLGQKQIPINSRVKQNIVGNPMEKRRALKGLYIKSPLFIRSFLYFIYRYIFKFGFLDGKEGLIFHFLQGFWFRFLVDAKIYEIYEEQKYKNLELIIKANQSVKL